MHNSLIGNRLTPGFRINKFNADWLLSVAVYVSVLFVTVVFFWILSDLIWNGFKNLSWSFVSLSPRDAGRAGGIFSIIVSTLLILAICLCVSLPLGLGAAVFLAEFTSATNILGRCIRCSLDILAGVPSIVFGLFGSAFFCVYLNMGFSILSGGLTLACMILPLLIRATEEGLRSVPETYRLGAHALGMSQTRILFSIILPMATPGLIVGLILGIGRAMAETAALIFTSGYVDRMPSSLMDSGRALSVHIYDLSMNVAGGEPNAYTTALVLIIILIITNLTASFLTERWLTKTVFVK